MKLHIYKTILGMACLAVGTLVSCNKYLDVLPKGVQLLETTRDYDLWLNNIDVEYSTSSQLNQLDDKKDLPTISASLTTAAEKIFTWQAQFSETVPGTAEIWQTCYKPIYLFNTVIGNVDRATGPEQERKRLKAEALLGRGYEYLLLVNLYAKVYNPATANKDLAVPFITSVDITDPTPGRSTVQEIYDHIISDITAALPDLPRDNSANRFRGSLAGAHGTLARAYLYMSNFSKAAEHAQLALDNGPNAVVDYTIISDAKGIPSINKRPDALYARLGGSSNLSRDLPTLDFLKSFDTRDLRLKIFYTSLGDFSFNIRGRTFFVHSGAIPGGAAPNWGISVAEMRLILAEAAARNNDLTTACNQLDFVRKVRFMPANYQKYISTDKEEVLQKVLTERTFELAFCGLRWFDMRRLDAEGGMPAVNRYAGNGDLIATLAPGSPRYTLQIPVQVMYFNGDWVQNP